MGARVKMMRMATGCMHAYRVVQVACEHDDAADGYEDVGEGKHMHLRVRVRVRVRVRRRRRRAGAPEG